MPSLTITWNATLDQHTCPTCKALNGYQWTFTTPEPMPDVLTHPAYGVVWNTTVGSQAHGHERFNCRCHMSLTGLDFTDVNTWLTQKKQELEKQVNE